MDPSSRLVYLTSAGGSFEAHLVAARLSIEGIKTDLRGDDGPYPVAREIEIFVREDDLEVARQVLLTDAVDDALEPIESDREVRRRVGRLGSKRREAP